MRIATWNINSIRIRLDLLKAVIKQTRADVLCLQEIKVQDIHFPLDEVRKLGLDHIYFCGQKSYNGVAILSRFPLTDIHSLDVLTNGDKRHIMAKLPDGTELHNFYVPAGGDIPDPKLNPKFKDKLKFMDELAAWSHENKSKKMIMVGDLNIAPYENDVWSHKQLLKIVSHTPIETEKMGIVRETLGWIDCAREFVPMDQKLYSWWSYRNHDWAKSDRGRRLDHIWVTPALRKSLKSSEILKEIRGLDNPSDHVPVVVELN